MKTSVARLALRVAMVAASSLAFGSLLTLLAHACGPRSAGFAFLLVWLSMCWVTLVLSAFPLQLPAAYYNLRPGERDGRRYEKVGVLVAKRVLRRGRARDRPRVVGRGRVDTPVQHPHQCVPGDAAAVQPRSPHFPRDGGGR